jgi:hypothetical protein
MKNELAAKSKRVLESVRISPASEKGSFIIEAQYKRPPQKSNEPWQDNPSEPHVAESSKKMIALVCELLKVKESEDE